MKFLVAFFVFFGVAFGDNSDPVVIVHGLASKSSDMEYYPEVQQAGLRTILADVSSYSSNWDRAAELYAQLKGTVVDYGVCHSRFYGHLRFGTDYTGKGFFPEWDESHKAHFMGHSMGGTTIRTLERLLEDGSGCDEDTSELFTGGHNWITSITTLASPMDGTTIFDDIPGRDPIEFIESTISFVGWTRGETDLPQWGLVQGEDESFRSYWRRVKQSGVLESEDFSIFDLSPEGSKKFNKNGPQIYPGRYYYSFAAERTNPRRRCTIFLNCGKFERPALGMSIPMKVPARWIGDNKNKADRVNDGVVNQVRARCPSNDNCKDVTMDNMEWESDQWHTVMVSFLDHIQIIFRNNRNDRRDYEKSAKRIYLEQGLRIKKLPSTSVQYLDASVEFQQSEKAYALEKYVEVMRVLTNFEDLEENSPVGGILLMLAGFILVVVGGVQIYRNRKLKFTENENSIEDKELAKHTL